MTSAREQIVESLANKEYRDAYVSEHIGQGIAFQIRATRKDRGWTQTELAARTDMKQARVSELENPDYESFTLKTLMRLASAFDVALIVRFAPFSALVDWSLGIADRDLAVPSFTDDIELRPKRREQTEPRMARPDIANDAVVQPFRVDELMPQNIILMPHRGRGTATGSRAGRLGRALATTGRWG